MSSYTPTPQVALTRIDIDFWGLAYFHVRNAFAMLAAWLFVSAVLSGVVGLVFATFAVLGSVVAGGI